jgi:hypothetical protein
MESTMRRTMAMIVVMLLLAAACGGSPEDTDTTEGGPDTTVDTATTTTGGPSGGDDDPCGLATPEMVAAAFGGTADEGVPGVARNCTFTITGGIDENVNVYHYGSADNWDGVRQGFEDNRGGTTDVPGLGDDAFYPNDQGPLELVARAGDVVFSVGANFFGPGGAEVEAALFDLAEAIAAAQG